MIGSWTIQNNGDRTYHVSFIFLSHNEENDQKEGFRDLKWRNRTQNQNLHEKLSKIGPVEIFLLLVKSQRRMERVFNSQKLQSACVQSSVAVLGWVLLEIGCSIAICLCFGSLMNRMMRSESYRDYGCDGGNLLLIVATGWKQG